MTSSFLSPKAKLAIIAPFNFQPFQHTAHSDSTIPFINQTREYEKQRSLMNHSFASAVVLTLVLFTVANFLYFHASHTLVNSDEPKQQQITKQKGDSDTLFLSYEYMRNRSKNQYFDLWHDQNGLLEDADQNGTILDFVVAGFAKCGTTSMEANLAQIAPMPNGDVCTPVKNTVYYAYKSWPAKEEKRLYRGTKCPAFIQGTWLNEWSLYLPKTKVIVGIRHPVRWYESFWNMQAANGLTGYAHNDPYNTISKCNSVRGCQFGCPKRQLVCTQRARFHIALARLGKTQLTEKERELLAPEDIDGGVNLVSNQIRNSVYLYEIGMMNEDYLWKDLSEYIDIFNNDTVIKNEKIAQARGTNLKATARIDICDDLYDDLRGNYLMPISYNVSVWLTEYFMPLAKDENKLDVHIPNVDAFHEMVQAYKFDPCGKLDRRESDGTYVLSTQKTEER